MRNHPVNVEQEQVFRTHCSTRSDISTGEVENEDCVSLDDGTEETEEAWDLVKILSVADITDSCPVVCQTEGCRLKAGVIYVSSSKTKWYGCLDCQVCSHRRDSRNTINLWLDPSHPTRFCVKGYRVRGLARIRRYGQSHPHRRAVERASQALFQKSHACHAHRLCAGD